MAGTTGRAIPWCTIFLVAGALAMHTLVLLGNLQTAKMMQRLGSSTRGWSHVGQHLADSLDHELDVLMGEVSTGLTIAIKDIMAVKSGVDMAVYFIGQATDNALFQVKDKAALIAYQKLIVSAASKQGWPGPKAKPTAFFEHSANSSKLSVVKTSEMPFGENDVVWMMEKSRSFKSGHADINAATLSKIRDSAMLSLKSDINQVPDADVKPTVFENLTFPANTPEAIQKDEDIITWCLQNPAQVEDALNSYLKNHYDEANALWHRSGKEATEWAVSEIDNKVSELLETVNTKLNDFLRQIKPTLEQIGKWLISFGTKVQTTIIGFSTTLDKVQKIFDKLMTQLAKSEGKDTMIHETYTLFDASNTGSVSPEDLDAVGSTYGIAALTGKKAKSFVTKYDADKDGTLSKEEFSLFIEDESIPGVMAVVLRSYAKKLAEISGLVGAARKREEVAQAVTAYLSLVSVKNATKVSWVAAALTNASVPMAFTGDILKEFASDVDDPTKKTTVEPGKIVVNEMVSQNAPYVAKVLALMTTPEYWISEGFDIAQQPKLIHRITQWVVDAGKIAKHAKAKGAAEAAAEAATAAKAASHHSHQADAAEADASSPAHSVHLALYQLVGGADAQAHAAAGRTHLSDEILAAMPAMAEAHVTKMAHRHHAKQRAHRAQVRAKLFSSKSASMLFGELFHGSTAGSTSDDPEALRALNSGVPATPETLQFAKYLAWNSSAAAERFQNKSSLYMGDSSSALDSFATQIQSMIKKIQNFLNQMLRYSTPTGIAQLEDQLKKFVENGEVKVKQIIRTKVMAALPSPSFDLPHALGMPHSLAVMGKTDPGNVFMAVGTVMAEMQTILPVVIADVQFAKTTIAALGKQLRIVFDGLLSGGPHVFDESGQLYSTMWTTYYILFTVLTCFVLFYGFWSTGWFGGATPPPRDDDGAGLVAAHQASIGFMGRVRMICGACGSCVHPCHDNMMCFWSCIIIFEIIVLLMFIIAILLTLIGGIRAFMGAGCANIYFLSDPTICTGILQMVKSWLNTFWKAGASELEAACHTEDLLTCELIQEQLGNAMMYTTAGSMAAAMLTFQMIVNTAQLHEQARWVRTLASFDKD